MCASAASRAAQSFSSTLRDYMSTLNAAEKRNKTRIEPHGRLHFIMTTAESIFIFATRPQQQAVTEDALLDAVDDK